MLHKTGINQKNYQSVVSLVASKRHRHLNKILVSVLSQIETD